MNFRDIRDEVIVDSTTDILQTVAGIPTQPLGSLVGYDAVVSTVGKCYFVTKFGYITALNQSSSGHLGMKDQIPLIEQAKRDGVKRFVPSEFGVDSRVVKDSFFDKKVEVFEAVEKANFPEGRSECLQQEQKRNFETLTDYLRSQVGQLLPQASLTV